MRCTVTCAAIGNSVLGMCFSRAQSNPTRVWVLRSAWDGAVHFLRARDERQVVDPPTLVSAPNFANRAHLPSSLFISRCILIG